MFGFLNGALTGSTQRYITYELGRGDFDSLRSVFRSSLQLHFIIAAIVVLLAEPVGIWLLYNKMQIPADRMTTCFWVFQLSIATFVTNVISVPYNATIIAHERMSIFAYVSIVEVLMRLLICFLLLAVPQGRLLLYALLIFFISAGIRLFYGVYCKRKFPETIYQHGVNRPQLREMLSFSGWNLFGNLASVVNTQGLNIMLNIFFGPVVNAARGIAVQVQATMNQFCSNFQTAVNPELTKSYAAGEYDKSLNLMYRSCRFSFYLLFMITLPLILETDAILLLWLKEVPEHTTMFMRILLICQLSWTFTNPITTVAYATGHIQRMNTYCALVVLMTLPVSWILLSTGAPAWTAFAVYAILEFVSMIVRLIIFRTVVSFSITDYFKKVYLNTILVALLSTIIGLLAKRLLPTCILSAIVVCIFSAIVVIAISYIIGMDSHERMFVTNAIKSKIHFNR